MLKQAAILKHLETKGSITALEALGLYGVFRLASCVERFRKAGHDISTVKKLDPNGQEYGRYLYHGKLVEVDMRPKAGDLRASA
jgi:hypothetical protein